MACSIFCQKYRYSLYIYKMKRILLSWLAVFPLLLFAQTQKYTIEGKVGNYNPPSKVFLLFGDGQGKSVKDSAVIKNGLFSFQGPLSEPAPAVLVFDGKGAGLESVDPKSNPDILRFYVENGIIKIQSKDSLAKATVSGKTNAEDQKLQIMLKPVQNKLLVFNNEFMATPEEKKSVPGYMEGMQARYEVLNEEQNTVLKQFIRENPASYVSLTALRNVAGQSPDPAELEPLIALLSPGLQKSTFLEPLLEGLESAKKTAVGVQAMEFTQNDPDGKPVKLSDFRGKYVLLDFWASWCGPCRQENPNVVNAYNKYKDKNFTVLGISLDRQNGKEAWLKAIKDDGLTWTQVSDLQFWHNEVAVMYGVQAIPKNFLIDPQGKIVATDLRGADLERKLAEVLR